MADEDPPISTQPATAIALWLDGIEPPPRLAPSEDRLGAELYERALTLYQDTGQPRFLPVSTDIPRPASDAYATGAVIVRHARAGTLTDAGAALTDAIVQLGQISPTGDSPSLWVVANELLVEAFRQGVLRDNSLMWKMAETALADAVTAYDLLRINELCILTKSRSTPRAQSRWARLRYDVAVELCCVVPGEQDHLDDRFDAIGDYAAAALPASNPAIVQWITDASIETLRDLDQFITSGHPAFDIWIGSVLEVCDALMAARRATDCRVILRLANEVVNKCGPGGPTALQPDQPSPRRKDAAFLLELLDTTSEVSAP